VGALEVAGGATIVSDSGLLAGPGPSALLATTLRVND
jgi:hypothetical protein